MSLPYQKYTDINLAMADPGTDGSYFNDQYRAEHAYSPLDPAENEVRLLKVPDDNGNNDLTCSIVTVSLHAAPDYSAISYVWGDPVRRRVMKLDGSQVSVLATAVEALQHMHAAAFTEPGQPAYIWIDAVCIDLDNDQERSQQVTIMSEIYSNATQVLAYLGPAFAAHTDIQRSICAAANALRKAAGSRRGLDRVLDFDTDLPVAECLAGLDNALLGQFYGSSWFTRLWILQEAALAKAAFAFYGSSSLPLSDAIVVARALVKMERHSGNFETNRDSLSRGISRCKTLYNLRVWHACELKLAHQGDCRKGQCYTGLPLTYLLEVMHSHANSEMRDKVYAILGLADSSVARQLQPDYKLSLQTVYTQATRIAFQQDNSYEVMRWARTCGNRPDEWYREHKWPTWLPLWQASYDRLKNPSGLPWWTFKASNIPTILPQSELSAPILHCQGVFVDDLQSTSETLLTGHVEEDDNAALQVLQEAMQKFAPLAKKARGIKPGDNSHFTALAMTLAAGALKSASQDELDSRKEHLDAALAVSELADIADSSLTRNADTSNSGQAVKYLYHFKFHSRFRKVFFTKDGYMGLASQHVKEGDSLFVPNGNSLPWILRREGDHYLFMGVCYVHGLMHGELRVADETNVEDVANRAQWIDIH